MNRPRNASISRAVHDRIARGGTDRLWTYADFAEVPDRAAIATALSRLAKRGELRRVRRGIYYRPKATIVGDSKPNPNDVAAAYFRARGETSIPGGLSVYHRLGFTDQVPYSISRVTAGRASRTPLSNIPNAPILVARSRSMDGQRGITLEERAVLDALRDLKRIPGAEPTDILRRIVVLFSERTLAYDRLARFALAEPPRVRALMGAIGDVLESSGLPVGASAREALRATLNPLTAFRISGVSSALPGAADWRIHGSRYSSAA